MQTKTDNVNFNHSKFVKYTRLPPGYMLGNRYRVDLPIQTNKNLGVYLGTDNKTKQKVVIKFKANVCREFKVLKSINHPNVVKAYDLAKENSAYYLVMEYVEGIIIGKYMRQYAPIKEIKIRSIFKSLTETVTELTTLYRVQHGDITGGNIIIRNDSSICLIDFEWGTHSNWLTSLKTALKTAVPVLKNKRNLSYSLQMRVFLLGCMTGANFATLKNFLHTRQLIETDDLINQARANGYSKDLIGLVENATLANYNEKEQIRHWHEVFLNETNLK
ncbi:MAG: protein kinase [Methylococcales symbiont of Hymedesmia sp. n. MRB-2018]|nr:MAG: protein kinase [Methylococcales symbiont of Hymedesmia sp. n. MRB-2018]